MNGPPWYTSPPDPEPTAEELIAHLGDVELAEALDALHKSDALDALAALLLTPLTPEQVRALAPSMPKIGEAVRKYFAELPA